MNSLITRVEWSSEESVRSIACHDCDALLTVPSGVLATFSCPRCHCVILRRITGGLDWALAFYLAAAVFFMLGNTFPIVQIVAGGTSVQTTLIGAVRALHAEHMNLIAMLVLATTVVIPAVDLFCTTAVLLLVETRHPLSTLAYFFRLRQALKPWNMVEILMLGTFVAIVKLGSLASVVVGIGLWSLAAFMIAHAAATHVFDPKEFWNEIKRPP